MTVNHRHHFHASVRELTLLRSHVPRAPTYMHRDAEQPGEMATDPLLSVRLV